MLFVDDKQHGHLRKRNQFTKSVHTDRLEVKTTIYAISLNHNAHRQ